MTSMILLIFIFVFLSSGIRIVYQYKRAIKFRFGRYIEVMEPGLDGLFQ